ncbi:pirin family protein [Paenibacillus provencensis]|uniref:Pirin family protein n=1 Tax=Paenibacillus provencensis TaxID=441151 RepID=A0ABW3PMF5_9BACL|nr:pirin family protein [Paenibacillus sp. MER 78]MCM3129528.1 pirin family protein [Paenibacillus sp. MER 78]
MQREITRVWTVTPVKRSSTHTAGIVLEPGHWHEYDPFLLMAEDWFESGTFSMHPHRGFETVTYIIEGNLSHFDNKNGAGQLGTGDVQWMTAGRGVVHTEEPSPGETVHSLQLWVNLPRDKKMTDPRYQNLLSSEMPVRKEEGALIRVFSGSSKEVVAPTQNHVPVTMVELNLEAGSTVTQDLPADYNGFLYILEGRGIFGSNEVSGEASQVLWLGEAPADEGSDVLVHATTKLRAVLFAGKPVREPVVQYGMFVMNSQAEIQQAIKDYQSGKFSQ